MYPSRGSSLRAKMRKMIVPETVFGIVAVFGFLAATRPQIFTRYVLPKWQRSRLAGNMSAVSWTGWIIFGFATVASIGGLILNIPR